MYHNIGYCHYLRRNISSQVTTKDPFLLLILGTVHKLLLGGPDAKRGL